MQAPAVQAADLLLLTVRTVPAVVPWEGGGAVCLRAPVPVVLPCASCTCARGGLSVSLRALSLRSLADPPPPITGYLRARVFVSFYLRTRMSACVLPQDTWYPAEDRHGNLYSGFDDGKVQNTSVGSACTRPAPKYVKALGLAGLAAR